jgi:hypothetical protein
MTTPEDAEDRLRAARAELDLVIGQARRDLARFEQENRPTAAQLHELQEAARRGELGFDLRELARRVDEGDSWPAIFDGSSPNAVLLRGLVTRMLERHGEAVRAAVEQDEDLDPAPDDLYPDA